MSKLWTPIEDHISRLNGERCMPGVHHYTSLDGALGILTSGKIWFTERAHLNDPSEISNGVEIAAAILREQGREDDAVRLEGCAQRVFQDFCFFSASYSLERDDLHQWTKYADDGRGVALSFKASAFCNPKQYIDNLIPNNPTAIVCPMSYDSEYLRKKIATMIEIWDKYSIYELCDHVIMISSMFKNECWAFEKEYRFFVHGNRSEIMKSLYYRSRERNGEIVAYLEIPIQHWDQNENFPIYHICIGPAASPELDVQIVDFLSSKSIPVLGTALSRSQLPYRSNRRK